MDDVYRHCEGCGGSSIKTLTCRIGHANMSAVGLPEASAEHERLVLTLSGQRACIYPEGGNMLTHCTVAVVALLAWDTLIHFESEVCEDGGWTTGPADHYGGTQIEHVWRYARCYLSTRMHHIQAPTSANLTPGQNRCTSIFAM